MTGTREIPYRSLETIFLDVGNTLVSMDYTWLREELRERDIEAELGEIHRAEAAARPVISETIGEHRSTEGKATFTLYLETLLRNLGVPSPDAGLVDELACFFRRVGPERFWTYVLPGVPRALERFRGLGLRLAVVSNSDGSVERVLTGLGLRPLLDAVFDSHLVGLEKPDPRFFEHALAETGASPETTLHIGDLYAADAAGGRAAGLHVALVDPFGDWPGVDCPRFADVAALAHEVAQARGA